MARKWNYKGQLRKLRHRLSSKQLKKRQEKIEKKKGE